MIYEYGKPGWNDTDKGKLKNSEKTCLPVPLDNNDDDDDGVRLHF
jgi:hypothetical protein